MSFIKTDFEGLFLFEPVIYEDERGHFFESYNEKIFRENNIDVIFVQDNQSFSKYGVIRGMHFQRPPYEQSKLVRVLHGVILDVVVDIRRNSSTFGKSFSIELSSANRKQLFIPKGFAHGFSVLSEYAEVLYKCDALYHKASEGGILYNDPVLQIDWQVPAHKMIISEKDRGLPLFKEYISGLEKLL